MLKKLIASTLAFSAVAMVAQAGVAFAHNHDNDKKFDEHLIVITDLDRYTGKHNKSIATQDLLPSTQKIDRASYQFYLRNAKALNADQLLPLAQNPTGGDVGLRVQNPTNDVYFLTVPSQNIKRYIPVQSERSAVVDMSGIRQGGTVAYYLTDGDGNNVAGGYILNGSVAAQPMHSLSKSTYDQWGVKLQEVIANQQYTLPTYEQEEPVRTSSSGGGGVVRGYW